MLATLFEEILGLKICTQFQLGEDSTVQAKARRGSRSYRRVASRGGTYIVMKPASFGHHARAHVEAVKEYTGSCECRLWKLEQNAGL